MSLLKPFPEEIQSRIKALSHQYLPEMTAFLRRIVADPGECAHEKKHAETQERLTNAISFSGYRKEGR